MTEDAARAHPRAQTTAELFGAEGPDHQRAVKRLMAGET